jgi:signal transduction histidine kinase/ActR/RegA family two-component response regulator
MNYDLAPDGSADESPQAFVAAPGVEPEQLLRSVLGGMPCGLFLLDPDGRFALLNRTAARFFQKLSRRAPADLIGRNIARACPEVADSSFIEEYRRAEREERDFHLEAFFPQLHRWFAFHGVHSRAGLCLTLQDVTERTKMEQALRSRIEQLVAAEHGKEEFLLPLAHELRDALAPIRNALHLWGAGELDAAGMRQAREMAEWEVQNISRLLDDLLRVSQLAQQHMQARQEPLDLATAIARALQTTLAAPVFRGQCFTVNLPAEALPVAGDPLLLEQVFRHLLQNAVQGTQPDGQIGLEAQRAGEDIVVRVRDNGIGIAAEMLPHVFDLLTRAEGRLEGRVGLALVRRIVEAHGGEVEAHSAGLGQGSEFVVRLPALHAAVETDDSAPPHRVLFVGDSAAAQGLGMLLQVWGYEVALADDPRTALQQARAEPPAIILLDLDLPEMEGDELARRLRHETGAKKVLLVALTSFTTVEEQPSAQPSAFDHHLSKPVDPKDLKELLEAAGFHGKGSARVA